MERSHALKRMINMSISIIKMKKHKLWQHILIILTIGLIGFWAAQPHSLYAQSEVDGITINSQVGFDGYFKSEHWVPVQIDVANSGPAIEGELRVTIGTSTFGEEIHYVSPISLPTQSSKRVTIYAYIPRVMQPTVGLYDDNGRLIIESSVNQLNQIPVDGLLYAVISPDPGEFSFLEKVSAGRTTVGVAFLELADLPETAVTWRALDILMINDVDTAVLSQEQLAALKAWVDVGGQLIVTGGGSWQKTTAALSEMLPVTVTGSESVADLPALTQSVNLPFRDPGPYVVTTSQLRGGELLYHQDGLPLLASTPYGSGTVYFLALDPKLAPMLDWDGSEVMLTAVANRVQSPPPWALPAQNSYAARTAVSSLPALALPSVWQFIIFLLIYIILIGPINYILLKRRNMLERAWISIPVFIVLFSGGAYVAGFQLRGNDVLINQMSIAYSHSGAEQAQVQSFIGLYSPDRSQYDLVLPNQNVIRPISDGFSTGAAQVNLDSIGFGNEVTVNNVRVDISGIESFVAQSIRPALSVIGQASLEVQNGRLLLNATIQNNSDTLLSMGSLLLGDTAVYIGDIKPGEIRTISEILGTASTSQSGSFAPATTFFPTGGGSLLTSNAGIILNSYDYYDDPELHARYQLLQAFDSSSGSFTTMGAVPGDAVTLLAWSDEQQMDVQLNNHPFDNSGETLYFIEMPLTQNLVSGTQITLPRILIDWEVLSQSNLYYEAIENFSLNGGWIEYEFTPWAEFQHFSVEAFAINLLAQVESEPVPVVRLWDWQEGQWVVQEGVSWGETGVSDYSSYIGTNNKVRIRLEDNTQYGVNIDLIHPLLTLNQE
jgi:hypothetical protein